MNITGELRLHLGDGYATLKFSDSGDALSIDVVFVPAPHRGKGIGSALIRPILQLADINGKNTYLTARPIGVCDDERIALLVGFYEQFGFVETDRGATAVYMKRTPQASVGRNHAASLLATDALPQAEDGGGGADRQPLAAAELPAESEPLRPAQRPFQAPPSSSWPAGR